MENKILNAMSKSTWKNKNTIAQLQRLSGLNYNTLWRRINVLKWNKLVAINTPTGGAGIYKKQLKKVNGNS